VSRPTCLLTSANALLHNLKRVKACAPQQKVMAVVKANAYGTGLDFAIPVLNGQVDAFAVSCLEEALKIRELGSRASCLVLQGVFNAEEWRVAARYGFDCVIHHQAQLKWLLSVPLPSKIKVWVKINTGMHRLGFAMDEVEEVLRTLESCPWVDKDIRLMTHLARADERGHPYNDFQFNAFNAMSGSFKKYAHSIANSAAILSLPKTHADVVRPGIMLYGVSPFENQTGVDLGLMPVARLMSAITVIHHYPAGSSIGYGGTYTTDRPSIIGIVPVGYGDGYPRHIQPQTPVWVNGVMVPVVGRVSMDMLTIDLTTIPDAQEGDPVELWGPNIPIEQIATSAGTIAYELLCQMTDRLRGSATGLF